MSYFLGAYASSPCVSTWEPLLETEYYQQLKSFDNLTGLEHPFTGTLHPHDDEWFLSNIKPQWDFVFTCVPGIMSAKAKDPSFGIASDDEHGRQLALSFMKDACAAVTKLNSSVGRKAVKAIQIQTSPSQHQAKSSVNSLINSLTTMLTWDWQGTKIVIEHCDCYIEGQIPAKGFLTLAEEIEAVIDVNKQTNSNVGICINWGRSVIETRSVDGALQHIKQAQQHNILAGLMFSGVSDQATDYVAWKDSHMPPAKSQPQSAGADGSLMTQAQIHKCLAQCANDKLTFLGVKIGIRPVTANVDDRVAYNKEALAILDRFSN